MKFSHFALAASFAILAGCADQQADERPDAVDEGTELTGAAAEAAARPASEAELQEAAKVTQAPAPRPAARATAAQLDTTTDEQKAAAAKPAETKEVKLGTTIASLGDVSESGFWIKTPLAKTKAVGRLVNPANGKSTKVDLIPLDGPASGGSQVSLPALQLLGVSLTDLPELEVYRS